MSRQAQKSATPGRPTQHSRESIVIAALAHIDAYGLEAFSTRKFVEHLGLKVMSLYHYFPSREALLDAVVDNMIAEISLPDIRSVDWQQGLLGLATGYRTMGWRHLQAIPLLVRRCPNSPAMENFLHALSGLLLKAAMRPPEAAAWLIILQDYVVGSLVNDHAGAMLTTELADNNHDSKGRHANRERRRKLRNQVFEKGYSALLEAIRCQIEKDSLAGE